MTETTQTPRWDLSNVYPGLESDSFIAATRQFEDQIQSLESFFSNEMAHANSQTPLPQLAGVLEKAIQGLNQIYDFSGTLRAYVGSFVSTDSRNTTARRTQSELDGLFVRLQKLGTAFRAWIGKLGPVLDALIESNETIKAHAFPLRETYEQSQYMMSPSEEALASELNVSGASAWGKLQGTITSQLSVDFELDGKVQKLPMPALVNLHSHPDESVRRRAYEAEMKAWESVSEPLAACLNGIKGTVNTLNRHRQRSDALHSALDMARIDRETLDAMIGAMQDSLPTFRKYFRAKARRLGKEQLPWWDVFAPVGESQKHYSFPEACSFILENFSGFSPELAALAQRSFDNNWIDAEPRSGKSGGAFCMGLPAVKESRVLCNFDGTLDQVSTIAHELGHAFHNHCIFQAHKTAMQRSTPMTLAETASIMCETIIMDAVLSHTTDPKEELAILETRLIGDTQVIVDILSRFIFEKEVFERREKAELSVTDFCEIMERAQEATYGEGLDPQFRHKYMWTWKSHYYSAYLSFYNFPYAFGLLFGLGLYAIYQQRGAAFVPDYISLLASTGEGTAAELAARFGIDIHQRKFWEDSLAIIGRRIERYCEL